MRAIEKNDLVLVGEMVLGEGPLRRTFYKDRAAGIEERTAFYLRNTLACVNRKHDVVF